MTDKPVDLQAKRLAAKNKKSLQKAKLKLMGMPSTVFYTTILFSLIQEFTDKVPTAATNGTHLLINPEYWSKLNPKTQIGLLLHEVMHVALDHMSRLENRDHKSWNIAADHVINLILVKQGYSLPQGALHDTAYKDLSTERVYRLVYKKEKDNPSTPIVGDFGPNDIHFPKGKKDIKATKDKVTGIVLRAATQANVLASPGSIPGEVAVQLDAKINPKLPWQTILQNYMTEFAKDDFTFKRPNRRFSPQHYLPSLYSESIANIAVAVDCSGSVSDSQFSYFIKEIDQIKKTLNPKKISIISFDTRISKVKELTQEQNILKEIKFHGRGGTRIGPVLKWAEEEMPELLIIFTDGQFKPEPLKKKLPIIWIINDNPGWKSDFGNVIHCDLRDPKK